MDENHRTVGGSPMANIKTMIAPRTTQRLHHHKMHIALCLVATILMAAVLTFLPATTPTQWIICIIACCCPLGIAFAPVPMSVISFAVVLLLMFTPGISLSDAGSIIHMLTPLAIGTLAYSTPTQWSVWGLVTSIVTLLLAFDPREALSQGTRSPSSCCSPCTSSRMRCARPSAPSPSTIGNGTATPSWSCCKHSRHISGKSPDSRK